MVPVAQITPRLIDDQTGKFLLAATTLTIEKHLFGESRSDDVPGALVPEFYDYYLRTGNPGPLVPIVEHNRRDIVTLARLFARLCQEEAGGNENDCHR